VLVLGYVNTCSREFVTVAVRLSSDSRAGDVVGEAQSLPLSSSLDFCWERSLTNRNIKNE
jgi:hypothetical protein